MIDASAGTLASAEGAVDTGAGGVVSPAGVSPERPLTAPQPVRKAVTRHSDTMTRTSISWDGFGSFLLVPCGVAEMRLLHNFTCASRSPIPTARNKRTLPRNFHETSINRG